MCRPTKYKKEYCKKIIEFFDVPHTVEKERSRANKNGELVTWTEEVANSLPTFEGFAVSIDTHRETLINWCKKHKEFFDAYSKAKDLQKNMLIDLGARGLYNATFTIFTAKNITDMRDKVETVNKNVVLSFSEFLDEVNDDKL